MFGGSPVRRFAIGYSPTDIDHPLAVFVEMDVGVLFQRRGEAAAQLLDRPVGPVPANGPRGEVAPGSPTYFDVVLDSFSTSLLIRTVRDLEPDMISSMLLAEGNWDLLPRPQASPEAATA
jgi:hypothetical protein